MRVRIPSKSLPKTKADYMTNLNRLVDKHGYDNVLGVGIEWTACQNCRHYNDIKIMPIEEACSKWTPTVYVDEDEYLRCYNWEEKEEVEVSVYTYGIEQRVADLQERVERLERLTSELDARAPLGKLGGYYVK